MKINKCFALMLFLLFTDVLKASEEQNDSSAISQSKAETFVASDSKNEENGSILDILTPSNVTLSMFGYLGSVGFGAGYQLTDSLSYDMVFGWTPKYFGGDVKSVANRFEYSTEFVQMAGITFSPLISSTVLFALGQDYFVTGSPKWDAGYYEPTRIRYLASFGGNFISTKKPDYSFWVDLSVHDIEVRSLLLKEQPKDVTQKSGIGSLGLGVRKAIK